MYLRQVCALVIAMVVPTACLSARRIPWDGARRLLAGNPSWTTTLASPQANRGEEPITGSAAMLPGAHGKGMTLSVTVANATPRTKLPWQVRRGQCGADEGDFVPARVFEPVEVGDDGNGESAAAVPGNTPVGGRYFVTVSLSAESPQTVVACGNLALPRGEARPRS